MRTSGFILLLPIAGLGLAAGAQAEQPHAIAADAVPELLESLGDGAPPVHRLATRLHHGA